MQASRPASRFLVLQKSIFDQPTTDHSLTARQLPAGGLAAQKHNANVVSWHCCRNQGSVQHPLALLSLALPRDGRQSESLRMAPAGPDGPGRPPRGGPGLKVPQSLRHRAAANWLHCQKQQAKLPLQLPRLLLL